VNTVIDTVDLGGIGFGEGAHLLLRRALTRARPGGRVAVTGTHPALAADLMAWCRARGHPVEAGTARPGDPIRTLVTRGTSESYRWAGAERAGGAEPGQRVSAPSARWGLAARGALVERGGPPVTYQLIREEQVWADLAPRLYAQAAAAQWDPAAAVPWQAEFEVPDEIEVAVIQVMTFLIENEQAALVLPARFLTRIHPHFREVVQLLAVQAADEARHIEVFSRRAALSGRPLGTSSVGGRQSLFTLLSEPDFSLASFLLSVLGEGSFLSLLAFLDRHAPDPITRVVARLAHQDEARHVAFGVAHLEHQAKTDTSLLPRLRSAVERRHEALTGTSGLNEDVFDALVLLAAGSWDPAAIASGFAAVRELEEDMYSGRVRRLIRIGFPSDEAAEISALHTQNFM
jgi:TusA-related sulfurtransferase